MPSRQASKCLCIATSTWTLTFFSARTKIAASANSRQRHSGHVCNRTRSVPTRSCFQVQAAALYSGHGVAGHNHHVRDFPLPLVREPARDPQRKTHPPTGSSQSSCGGAARSARKAGFMRCVGLRALGASACARRSIRPKQVCKRLAQLPHPFTTPEAFFERLGHKMTVCYARPRPGGWTVMPRP
jgi:hypothetical protein